jgi:hypothetical protein
MKGPRDYAERLSRDTSHVINFCCRRRSRHADVRAACLRFLNVSDLDALASLLDAILTRGCYGGRERRVNHRLRTALQSNDQRIALLARLRDERISGGYTK